MSDPTSRWADLVNGSVPMLSGIERLGRQLAGAIAAEFAADNQVLDSHGTQPTYPLAADRPDDLASDLLDWVDLLADLTRDAIFTATDVMTATLDDPDLTLRARFSHSAGDSRARVWLHSAQGSATDIEPSVGPLRDDAGNELHITTTPQRVSVEEGQPTELALVPVDLATAPPGEYWGRIEAPGVTYGLRVCVTVTP